MVLGAHFEKQPPEAFAEIARQAADAAAKATAALAAEEAAAEQNRRALR